MDFLTMLFLAEEESVTFADLLEIAKKIIPDDPWAFVVQLSATFVLVLILAKFFVKPVRNYVAKRQAIIQGDLDEAASKNEQADIKLADANNQLKEARITSKEMVENAKVTALNEKDRILNETTAEVSQMKEKARKDIENERIQMKEELSKEVIDVALLAASKVVEREVSKEDNEKLIDNFIKDNK